MIFLNQALKKGNKTKMKKKAIALLMMACVMGFTGCGEGDARESTEVSKEESKESKEETEESKEESKESEEASRETESVEESTEVQATEESSQESAQPESEEDIFANPTTTNTGVYASPVVFDLSGVEFTIPGDYRVFYEEGVGPIVYISDVFQMKLGVREAAFSETLENIEAADDKALAAGATTIEEPTKVTIDGQTYVYFVVDLFGDKTIVVLSDGPEGKGHLGGQIVVFTEDVQTRDLLNMYASIVTKATATTKADSTEEEILSQVSYVSGEKRESSEITFEGKTITYKVPEGFYYTQETSNEYSEVQFYECANYTANISMEKNDYEQAEYYADLCVQYDDAKKYVYEVDGRNVYVAVMSYTYNDSIYNEVNCYCDLEDGYLLMLNAQNCNKEMPAFEDMKTFFEIDE